MKTFPVDFRPENKGKFETIRFNRNLAYMRKDVYELILKGNESDFFSLTDFSQAYGQLPETTRDMWDRIAKELENLGWKTKLSYGDTGAFIYSTDEPPPNCW